MECYMTRWSPGGPYPIRIDVKSGGSEEFVLSRGGSEERYTTWSGLVRAVHGHQFGSWSKDRYLCRGQYDTLVGIRPSLDLVGPFRGHRSLQGQITVVSKARSRGIDLGERGHEVARLLWSGFSGWILGQGYDFDDVLQEVYRKILVSNRGKSPWDPDKSTFGHYVHLICRSALSNFHRKVSRIRSQEQIGLPGLSSDGVWQMLDASACGLRRYSPEPPDVDAVEDLSRHVLASGHPRSSLAVRLLPLVQEGRSLEESRQILGVQRNEVTDALRVLRRCATEWCG